MHSHNRDVYSGVLFVSVNPILFLLTFSALLVDFLIFDTKRKEVTGERAYDNYDDGRMAITITNA